MEQHKMKLLACMALAITVFSLGCQTGNENSRDKEGTASGPTLFSLLSSDSTGVTFLNAVENGKEAVESVARIPYDLIGELASRVTVDEWLAIYRAAIED